MTNTTTIGNRIQNVFLYEQYYLKNTAADTSVTTYLSSSKSFSDLDTLRSSIINYQITIDPNTTLFNSANRLLLTVLSEYTYESLTDYAFSNITLLGQNSNSPSEASGEIATVNSVIQNAVGQGSLNQVGYLGATPATPASLGDFANKTMAVIGNTGFSSYSLLGVLTAVANAITTHLNNFINAVATAIGNTQIAPSTPITVWSCVATINKKTYALDKPIYTTSKDISTTIYNIEACHKWIDTSTAYIISTTGNATDCQLIGDASLATSKCIHYLHPNP